MLPNVKQLFLRVLALFLLSPLAVAAQAEQGGSWREVLNMTPGVTEVSRQIHELHMIIFWICVVIGVVVFAVMFYSMIVHRKSKGYTAANFHESTAVEIAWTVVPALILIVMAVPATKALINLYDTSDAELDIKVTGYQWKWQYEYLGQGVEFMSELSTPESEIYNKEAKGEFYLAQVNNPLVIPLAGLGYSYLRVGGDVMEQDASVGNEIVYIIQATVILLVTAQAAHALLRRRRHRGKADVGGVAPPTIEVLPPCGTSGT